MIRAIDQFVERFAGNDLRQLVERQVDAVVGDAALREIVGADAFRAVAGADLAAPVGGALGVAPLLLGVVERARSIAIALARLRCCERSSCMTTTMPVGIWVMRIAEFGLVDVLAAGALRAHGVDLQVGCP